MKMTKLTAAALVASVLGATAAQAATATGTANATVIGNISVVQTAPLNFGSFSPSATAGTITNFGVTTGGVSVVSAGGSGFFTATGNPNASFNISAPTTVTLTSGANSMVANLTGIPTTSALDNTGTRIFNATGVLNVAANQPAGSYTGTYTVTVNY